MQKRSSLTRASGHETVEADPPRPGAQVRPGITSRRAAMAVVTVSLVALIAGSVFVVRRSDGEVVARDEAPGRRLEDLARAKLMEGET